MAIKWEELLALAREIEQARTSGSIIDPEKARRLARAVLWLEQARRASQPPAVDVHRPQA